MEANEKPSPLRLCLVQQDIAWEDPNENWNHVSQLLRGQEGKFDLIVLPEMFTTGFTMRSRPMAEPAADSPTLAFMQYLAGKMGAVVMGSVIIEEDGNYYNRLLVVGADGLASKYDKRHLFRMAGEHEHYTPGSELQVVSIKGWRICTMICYDLRFPVWSRNGQSPEGRPWYDLLVYVANWPERRAFHWRTLLQARAIENQAFVAGVNRVGTDANEIPYRGDTMLCDFMGAVVAQQEGVEGLVTATLEWDALAEWREKFPAWQDADRFELYG